MHSYLLKKLLPFALTFIVGSFIGGLFKSHTGPATWAWSERATPLLGHEGPFAYRFERRHSCRMRRNDLVAETKPLLILFKPDAIWPKDLNRDLPWPNIPEGYVFPGTKVRVTFGADGRVQRVEPSEEPYPSLGANGDKIAWECMARAARNIQFEPEMVNSVPVTVTRDVEIHFIDGR
jgi:hypothetical protein